MFSIPLIWDIEKNGDRLLAQSTANESATFLTKLPCQEPIKTNWIVEYEVKSGSITKNGLLPRLFHFFENLLWV